MMQKIKHAASAVVEAITPKPSPAELTERLRAAKAELAEARKVTPSEPDSFLGLPDSHLVEPSIACCRAAMKARDAELAFRQGDSESDEIYTALSATLTEKAAQVATLVAARDAAQTALDAFCRGIDADAEKTAGQIHALNARRRAEDLPCARDMINDVSRKFRSLLGDLQLVNAAEWIGRPVPGRDPSEGDLIQSRINEIKRGDTERETRLAVKAMPSWEDRDAWVAKWLSADRAGREAMAEKGREAEAKARGWRR